LGAVLHDPYAGDRIELPDIVVIILWRAEDQLEYYSRERGKKGEIHKASIERWRALWKARQAL